MQREREGEGKTGGRGNETRRAEGDGGKMKKERGA